MKRFFVLLCCIVMLAGSSCTESSNEETALPSGTEETSDGYTFVKKVTGYSASLSTSLKIYEKGGSYYATLGSSGKYYLCSRNSSYSSSYTGSDPDRKYRYCVKPYAITYYFDI